MRTIEVNFSHEPARYHALMDAMISQDEIEGGYVMFCLESRDQGQRIGRFKLRETGDRLSSFAPARQDGWGKVRP